MVQGATKLLQITAEGGQPFNAVNQSEKLAVQK